MAFLPKIYKIFHLKSTECRYRRYFSKCTVIGIVVIF